MDVAATTSMAVTRPGKAAQAVGQIAKVAVAEAKSLGVDLPKNAQGVAASAIARGAQAGSVFAAIVVPEMTAEPTETNFDPSNPEAPSDVLVQTVGEEPDLEPTAINSTALEGEGDGALNDAELALALLEDIE